MSQPPPVNDHTIHNEAHPSSQASPPAVPGQWFIAASDTVAIHPPPPPSLEAIPPAPNQCLIAESNSSLPSDGLGGVLVPLLQQHLSTAPPSEGTRRGSRLAREEAKTKEKTRKRKMGRGEEDDDNSSVDSEYEPDMTDLDSEDEDYLDGGKIKRKKGSENKRKKGGRGGGDGGGRMVVDPGVGWADSLLTQELQRAFFESVSSFSLGSRRAYHRFLQPIFTSIYHRLITQQQNAYGNHHPPAQLQLISSRPALAELMLANKGLFLLAYQDTYAGRGALTRLSGYVHLELVNVSDHKKRDIRRPLATQEWAAMQQRAKAKQTQDESRRSFEAKLFAQQVGGRGGAHLLLPLPLSQQQGLGQASRGWQEGERGGKQSLALPGQAGGDIHGAWDPTGFIIWLHTSGRFPILQAAVSVSDRVAHHMASWSYVLGENVRQLQPKTVLQQQCLINAVEGLVSQSNQFSETFCWEIFKSYLLSSLGEIVGEGGGGGRGSSSAATAAYLSMSTGGRRGSGGSSSSSAAGYGGRGGGWGGGNTTSPSPPRAFPILPILPPQSVPAPLFSDKPCGSAHSSSYVPSLQDQSQAHFLAPSTSHVPQPSRPPTSYLSTLQSLNPQPSPTQYPAPTTSYLPIPRQPWLLATWFVYWAKQVKGWTNDAKVEAERALLEEYYLPRWLQLIGIPFLALNPQQLLSTYLNHGNNVEKLQQLELSLSRAIAYEKASSRTVPTFAAAAAAAAAAAVDQKNREEEDDAGSSEKQGKKKEESQNSQQQGEEEDEELKHWRLFVSWWMETAESMLWSQQNPHHTGTITTPMSTPSVTTAATISRNTPTIAASMLPSRLSIRLGVAGLSNSSTASTTASGTSASSATPTITPTTPIIAASTMPSPLSIRLGVAKLSATPTTSSAAVTTTTIPASAFTGISTPTADDSREQVAGEGEEEKEDKKQVKEAEVGGDVREEELDSFFFEIDV